jgi:hypothetical protein
MVQEHSDTHPKMEALQIELLRRTPAHRKMEMLVALNRSARTLALSGLRLRFPRASNAELNRYLAEILLGTELANRVCGEESGAG